MCISYAPLCSRMLPVMLIEIKCPHPCTSPVSEMHACTPTQVHAATHMCVHMRVHMSRPTLTPTYCLSLSSLSQSRSLCSESRSRSLCSESRSCSLGSRLRPKCRHHSSGWARLRRTPARRASTRCSARRWFGGIAGAARWWSSRTRRTPARSLSGRGAV